MPLLQQMANVGSEVGRAIRAAEESNSVRATHALTRALDLFDLTATDPRWRGARRREVLRARELFCTVLFADAQPAGDAEYLQRYFFQFAVAARR